MQSWGSTMGSSYADLGLQKCRMRASEKGLKSAVLGPQKSS